MEHLIPKKQWWAPVWIGLVADGQAKHYRQMRNALWLYVYFLLNANRRSGLLKRKLQTISSDMGVSRDTIMRWLNTLRHYGYVATSNSGRSLTIQVQNWKPIVGLARTRLKQSELFSFRGGKNPTARILGDGTNALGSDRTIALPAVSKERNINTDSKEMRQVMAGLAANPKPSGTAPWDRRERFAWELAQALNDEQGISSYRAHCWRYPEDLLRRVLSEVNQASAEPMPQGRSALFMQLLQHHAQ